ncbi:hypothetical protein JXB11_02275 [Candidatus Woesearchaeota archaeon]|nr:hypothetical protein [Candidatus Woesearchaeota archaeon]
MAEKIVTLKEAMESGKDSVVQGSIGNIGSYMSGYSWEISDQTKSGVYSFLMKDSTKDRKEYELAGSVLEQAVKEHAKVTVKGLFEAEEEFFAVEKLEVILDGDKYVLEA